MFVNCTVTFLKHLNTRITTSLSCYLLRMVETFDRESKGMDLKPKKPVAVMLDMAKHPIPREIFTLLGRKCLFAYSVSHIALLAMTFGYANIVTVYRFGVYSSLMTPNSINIAVLYYNKQYNDSLFASSIIASHLVIGISVDCYLLNSFKSREHTFGVLMILLAVCCVITDLVVAESGLIHSRYIVCFLSAVLGAISHWTSKLGYVVMLFDGNFLKFVESNYKFLSGYTQGGPKLRGDNVIVSVILISAFIGILLGLLALRHLESLSLTVLVVTCPFQLHCSGCLQVWGVYRWILPAQDRRLFLQQWFQKSSNNKNNNNNKGAKELEMAVGINPMSLYVDHTADNVGQYHSETTVEVGSSDGSATPSTAIDAPAMPRDSVESSSSVDQTGSRSSLSLLHDIIIGTKLHLPTVFDRAPLQPRQLQQYEDIMSAFGHKAELSRIV